MNVFESCYQKFLELPIEHWLPETKIKWQDNECSFSLITSGFKHMQENQSMNEYLLSGFSLPGTTAL